MLSVSGVIFMMIRDLVTTSQSPLKARHQLIMPRRSSKPEGFHAILKAVGPLAATFGASADLTWKDRSWQQNYSSLIPSSHSSHRL